MNKFIKYRHKETGLLLKKKKYIHSTVYYLDSVGTAWTRDCLNSLSMAKDPEKYGYNNYWNKKDFEKVIFELREIIIK